jgi:hypothetical protein
VGGRARAPLRKRLLPLAADGPPLRPHLGGLSTANWSVTSRLRVRKR